MSSGSGCAAARSSFPAEKRARFVAVCIRGIYRVHRIIIKYTVYVSRDWRRRLRSIDPARRERWTKSRWTNGEGRGGEEEEEVTDSGPEREADGLHVGEGEGEDGKGRGGRCVGRR